MSQRTIRDCDCCGVRDIGGRKPILLAIGLIRQGSGMSSPESKWVDLCTECAAEAFAVAAPAIDAEMGASLVKKFAERLGKGEFEHF